MNPTLTSVQFVDPAYNGGKVSNGWITSDGYLIEPGNTNGNLVDPWGWYLAQFEAGKLALDSYTAGLVRGNCAATGITPQSFWEYVGKPLVVMGAAITGAELLGSAGAGASAGSASGAGGTLAPTAISAPTVSVATLTPVSTGTEALGSSLAPLADVGATAGGGGLLSEAGAVLSAAPTALKTAGALAAAAGAAGAGSAGQSFALAPITVTGKKPSSLWMILLLAGAAGVTAWVA